MTLARTVTLSVSCVAWAALAQGRVSSVPSLNEVRQNHTATVLADGRVLVVGGRANDGLTALASCELYDPRTNRWSRVASLSVGRSHHAAALLIDGKVLVVGGMTHESRDGQNRFVALASAERFDPKKNVWEPVASLKDARNGHTATTLLDGSVLVVGGAREQRLHLATVERFDVTSQTWLEEAPVLVPRWMHAAVRDSVGRVVVVGGRSNVAQEGKGAGVSIAEVERFDPQLHQWQSLPAMSEPRQRAVVLAEPGDAGVVAIGGQTATSSTNYAEVWWPGMGEWAPFENHLSLALSSHAGVRLPGGDVLILGGEPPNAVDTSRVQRWVGSLQKWCLAGELKVARKQHTASVLLDGRVLVVGGVSGGLPEKTAELWSSTPGKCEEPPGLPMGW